MRSERFRSRAVRGVGVGWLVTLGVSVCALMISASLALALEPSKAIICLTGKHAAEVAVEYLPLEPANGATVPAGSPVVFSGESLLHNAPTFSVASSPALLSSPDIDSGTGSKSGAVYRFTSTKATATPRTIYWTVSFTFTPEDCESPSTFTTPMRALIVAPTEAELAASKRQQEEEVAKKKREEEAVAKKKEEEVAAAGSVLLDGLTIDVENSREAAVKLTCSDVAACAGKLTLTASAMLSKGKARHVRTEGIGTANFSIAAGEGQTIRVTLDKTGRALLSAAHGHLSATLTILRSAPLPNKMQTQRVHLEQQKATGKE